MATIILKKLDMTYDCSNGKRHIISVPDYKDNITDVEVAAGANGIMTEGIFEPDGYPLTKLLSATKIDTSKTVVVLA
ncbi:MAG: DUF2922 domain-containing protein [Eubacterium sp.]